MQKKYVTIFGGSGFVGTYLAQELAAKGYMVQIISRHPNAALKTKVSGLVGQVSTAVGNIRNRESIAHAIKNSDIVINLVGLLYESGKQKFEAVHVEASRMIAEECAKSGVERYLHMSALGVDRATQSAYARTKLKAEEVIAEHFPNTTIFRPSIIIGAEDNFFNLFAKMAKLSPALPLIGGGKTLFQPACVDDVAKAFVAALENQSSIGQTYELAGPETYSFKELLHIMLHVKGMKRALIPLPFCLATFKAFFLGLMPKPLLTVDQVKLLKTNNVMNDGAKGFHSLGITPKPIGPLVQTYLAPRD